MFLKCCSGANVGNELVWEKGTLGHGLESEPGRPCVITTVSPAKYVSEGELSNLRD